MRRLHPLVGVLRLAQYAVYGVMLPIFGLGTARLVLPGVAEAIPVAPIAALGLLLGAGYGIASYLRYTYRITEDTFDVHYGVFGRRERDIPHGRIQNVDVTRSIWQNLVGLATVRIETAGGGSTEARLHFVSIREAERLQRVLTERRAETRSADSGQAADGELDSDDSVEQSGITESQSGDIDARATRETSHLFTISDMELAIHVATTFRPGMLAVIVLGTPFVEEWVSKLLLAAAAPLGGPNELELAALTPDELLAVTLVGAPLGILSAWFLGMAVGLNQYYGFTLEETGEELDYERGLLSEFSGSIPLSKVQTLTVTENVFQRPLGYAGLSIDTAGYARGGGQNAGERSAIPLAERERVVGLIDRLEGADLDVEFTRPPRRARERYFVRFTVGLLLILAITGAVSRFVGGFSLWWTPALLAPLLPVLAHLKWVHRGYALEPEHILIRAGFLRRRTRVVPYDRLQTITRSKTVFQRRRDLANLVADTASGAVLNRGGAVAYDQGTEVASSLQAELRNRLQSSLQD